MSQSNSFPAPCLGHIRSTSVGPIIPAEPVPDPDPGPVPDLDPGPVPDPDPGPVPDPDPGPVPDLDPGAGIHRSQGPNSLSIALHGDWIPVSQPE
jgi:hypothetical protein